MCTLIIKYPDLKGFFAFFYSFDLIRICFLNSLVSTDFLSHGYNFKQDIKLLPFKYVLSSKNV